MVLDVRDTVTVNIEFFDGQTEGDVGYPYYVASCDELHFVTDGKTFEELMINVRECLQLCLHDADSVIEYGVLPDAKVKLMMDLPEYA
jgi:predicted RNase H-like HicB family nuclease